MHADELLKDLICHRLQVDNFQHVEIESKKRVRPAEHNALFKYLVKIKRVEHVKSLIFFDQFLDTPHLDLLRKGASLRLRYKKNGSNVYLQYKGPGFIDQGLLYRSEFSSGKLRRVSLEESHHEIIRFTKTSIHKILSENVDPDMRHAMRSHLSPMVLKRISMAPIVAVYQKEKFVVDLGQAFLEPSLDRISAFHINGGGFHPLSTFCEYENEIKASNRSLLLKLEHIPDLLKFDRKLRKSFRLIPELLDKYHRSAAIFLPSSARRPPMFP